MRGFWLGVGLLALAVLVIGGLAAFVILASPFGRTPAGGVPPLFTTHESRLSAEIASHKFWRRAKLTPDDARKIGEKIVAATGNDVVFVDDAGQVFVAKGLSVDPRFRAQLRDGFMFGKPEGVGERYVYFDLDNLYAAQPDLERVLRDLRAKIAVRDYND